MCEMLREKIMLFNSFDFLFYFLPFTYVVYFLLNRFHKYQLANFFLTVMSVFFYGYNEISYVWIILGSIALNYLLHRIFGLQGERIVKYKKLILLAGILLNLGLLYYFKYFNFSLEILSAITNRTITYAKIALPLGISFFTFQQIGFVVDSYKGDVPKQKFIEYALFVSFFPQLIAGPIVNHDEMLPQFSDTKNRKINVENMYLGARAFIYGLAKKVLIADTIGVAVDWGYNYHYVLDGYNTMLVVLMYSLQLYYDFSGYCDMARGLGYFFNIRIPLNFHSPFKSKNLVEFWKRWHMTLGRFFTRYVYIPLGGNRKGFARTLLNIFVVFLISGIWHGAGWTFILWGFLHAVLQVGTRVWWKLKEKCHFPVVQKSVLRLGINAISISLCFAFVVLAFGIFRAADLNQALEMGKNMLHMDGFAVREELSNPLCFKEFAYVLNFFDLEYFSAKKAWQAYTFLGLVGVITWGCKNTYETEKTHKPGMIAVLFMGILFVWSVLSLPNVSSFLYFNF